MGGMDEGDRARPSVPEYINPIRVRAKVDDASGQRVEHAYVTRIGAWSVISKNGFTCNLSNLIPRNQ
jgi:hypothetical protein